jgi:hypothetical protein
MLDVPWPDRSIETSPVGYYNKYLPLLGSENARSYMNDSLKLPYTSEHICQRWVDSKGINILNLAYKESNRLA